MKTSFAKPITKQPLKQEAVKESEVAIAEAQNSDESLTIQGMAGQVQGEFSRSDFTVPKLNLVNKTGELSNSFPAGSFLYNREVLLGDGKKPCQITLTRVAKFYMQDLPFGSGEMPKTFSSIRDVRAAGGALAGDQDTEEGVDRYAEAMTCFVLVKSPAGEHALFPFEHEGNYYALAQWLLTKSAYKQTGRKIFTDSQLALRAGIDTACYELTSTLRTNSMGSWYVPMVKLGAKHDEKFVEFVRNISK